MACFPGHITPHPNLSPSYWSIFALLSLLSSLLSTTLSFPHPTRTQIWLLPNPAPELSSKSTLHILTQGAQLNKRAFHLQGSDRGFK